MQFFFLANLHLLNFVQEAMTWAISLEFADKALDTCAEPDGEVPPAEKKCNKSGEHQLQG